MEYTPVKAEPQQNLETPDESQTMHFSTPSSSASNNPSDNSSMMECLTGSFTGMKLDIREGGNKRTADRITVEGSPMVPLPFKQPNLNPTPYKLGSQWADDNCNDTLCDSLKSFGVPLSPIPEHCSPKSSISHCTKTSKSSSTPCSEKVLVICSASNEHNTGDHQENMKRTALLCGEDGCLRRPELEHSIDWVNSDTIQAASLCDLLRVHEYAYLAHLEAKTKSFGQSGTEKYPPFYAPAGMLDTDTPLLPQSLEAAKRFCGAAMLAVDHVMNDVLLGHTDCSQVKRTGTESESSGVESGEKRHNKVFVIGRPPGHHAGPNGCVISQHHWQRPDMTSSGFCLLNTVAVAAAYARYQYGRLAQRNVAVHNSLTTSCISSSSGPQSSTPAGVDSSTSLVYRPPRIAIVDIDVHHGNGTEEIVENLTPHQVFLPLPSSWAPVSQMSYKPWLDETDSQDVLFSSIHLFAGERFYPCSGKEDALAADRNIINIELAPIGPGPWDYKARSKLSNVHREELCSVASEEFRSKVQSMLLPRIAAFKPDLLFISAGFDAHYDDNYHFLTEQDIHWVTEQLCEVTVQNGGHGVISVLEGGYSLSSAIPAAPKVSKGNAKTAAAAAVIKGSAGSGSSTSSATVSPIVPSELSSSSGDAAQQAEKNEKVRPVRSKAKKVYSADGVSVCSPANNDTTSGTASSTGGAEIEVKSELKVVESVAVDPHFKFAQRFGDGGLVKGVLAHVAALANKRAWK